LRIDKNYVTPEQKKDTKDDVATCGGRNMKWAMGTKDGKQDSHEKRDI